MASAGVKALTEKDYHRVEAALRLHNGIILQAAAALGVHRHTLRRYIDEYPDLEDVRAEADEELIDVAESHLVTNIKEGDMKTIRWYLERKGKNRGFNTRNEVTGADGSPLEFQTIQRKVVAPDE